MKRISLFLAMLLAVSVGTAQTKRSLHSLLNDLIKAHHTIISFSPTLTDKVFPKHVDTNGELETVLKQLLEDTGFGYKVIGGKYYQIYRQAPSPIPKPVKAVEKEPVLPLEKPDTICRITRPSIANPSLVLDTPTLKLPEQKPTPIVPVQSLSTVTAPLPRLAVKTNLLYDATLTVNLGVELGIGQQTSLDISGNYNNWIFCENRKMKHWLIQPEFRFWFDTRFSGGFWGIHLHGGAYNWGGMLPWGFRSGKIFGIIGGKNALNYRYQGWLAGGGINYGYRWGLGYHWGLETEIGVGYAYFKYDKFRRGECCNKISNEHRHYFGPTKISLSLVFNIR